MKYWDTSAILALLVEERASNLVRRFFQDRARIAVWWGTELECASALSRIEREASLSSEVLGSAFAHLHQLAASWVVIQPGEKLLETAIRLIRVHPLRAADALQLAAGIVASGHRPKGFDFICFDKRLAAAAQREGFNVLSG